MFSGLRSFSPHRRHGSFFRDRVRTSRWLNAPGEEEISVEHQRQGKPDEEVLCKLHDMGVSGQSVLDSVRQGRHDHIHATYQLLLRRRQQAHSAAPILDAADVEVSTGGATRRDSVRPGSG